MAKLNRTLQTTFVSSSLGSAHVNVSRCWSQISSGTSHHNALNVGNMREERHDKTTIYKSPVLPREKNLKRGVFTCPLLRFQEVHRFAMVGLREQASTVPCAEKTSHIPMYKPYGLLARLCI